LDFGFTVLATSLAVLSVLLWFAAAWVLGAAFLGELLDEDMEMMRLTREWWIHLAYSMGPVVDRGRGGMKERGPGSSSSFLKFNATRNESSEARWKATLISGFTSAGMRLAFVVRHDQPH
jgi:hypothetical protein